MFKIKQNENNQMKKSHVTKSIRKQLTTDRKNRKISRKMKHGYQSND